MACPNFYLLPFKPVQSLTPSLRLHIPLLSVHQSGVKTLISVSHPDHHLYQINIVGLLSGVLQFITLFRSLCVPLFSYYQTFCNSGEHVRMFPMGIRIYSVCSFTPTLCPDNLKSLLQSPLQAWLGEAWRHVHDKKEQWKGCKVLQSPTFYRCQCWAFV